MKNYYEILGIQKNASKEEIKKAYHRLAHKHHPHKGGDEKKFKEINEAYKILSDDKKRDQYDKFGRVFEGGEAAGAGFDQDFSWGNFGSGRDFDLNDFGDIFEEFFGFGAGSQRRKSPRKGQDIEVDIEIPLESVLKEQRKEISLLKMISCSRCEGLGAEPGTKVIECFSCRGTGEVQQIKRTFLGSFTRFVVCPECGGQGKKPERPCNVCKGEGRIKGEDKIEIFIPAGVDSNQIIKVAAKGEAAKRAGKAGDLYVRIFVKPHSFFERKGDDLYVSANISFSQAVLGDEINIPTIEGKDIFLNVPAGTESGKVLRISGKGIPRFGDYSRGNMYVELIINTPKKLTKKQKDLMEKLREEGM